MRRRFFLHQCCSRRDKAEAEAREGVEGGYRVCATDEGSEVREHTDTRMARKEVVREEPRGRMTKTKTRRNGREKQDSALLLLLLL